MDKTKQVAACSLQVQRVEHVRTDSSTHLTPAPCPTTRSASSPFPYSSLAWLTYSEHEENTFLRNVGELQIDSVTVRRAVTFACSHAARTRRSQSIWTLQRRSYVTWSGIDRPSRDPRVAPPIEDVLVHRRRFIPNPFLAINLGRAAARPAEEEAVWGCFPCQLSFNQMVHVPRRPSSGMSRRLTLVRTDVSEELSASIIRMTRSGELGTKYFFAACVGC
jgi:hypothetical protein